MSDQEFEGEIEFLDEDAEIIQQYVRNVENDFMVEAKKNIKASSTRMQHELAVIRTDVKQETTKRKRKQDDDSDYDPNEEYNNRKRKKQSKVPQNVSRGLQIQIVPKPTKDLFSHKMDLVVRRKLQLKVPDYDDPLCLPVRAIKKDYPEQQKLKNWNNLCLEHFKSYDTLLRVDNQPTVASKRIVVFKNVYNRMDKIETTMFSKLSVENKNGQKKTEVIQTVLPKYREKKLLSFRLTEKKRKAFYTKDEVLLTKEVNKGEESLVVYKPMESLSLVFKMFENNSEERQLEDEENDRKHLKEVGSCKMCAPCYQMSYRAVKVTGNRKVLCMICKRPCISTYNMLAHMKSHPTAAVRACKKQIAKCLATAVEYHYKCKICEEKFLSIKALRSHVRDHKGTDPFKCEVCNQTFFNV